MINDGEFPTRKTVFFFSLSLFYRPFFLSVFQLFPIQLQSQASLLFQNLNFPANLFALKGGYFSTKLLSNFPVAFTGMYIQITARMLPVKAIQTTLTALGVRAENCPKWSLARRKPKAEDWGKKMLARCFLNCKRSEQFSSLRSSPPCNVQQLYATFSQRFIGVLSGAQKSTRNFANFERP